MNFIRSACKCFCGVINNCLNLYQSNEDEKSLISKTISRKSSCTSFQSRSSSKQDISLLKDSDSEVSDYMSSRSSIISQANSQRKASLCPSEKSQHYFKSNRRQSVAMEVTHEVKSRVLSVKIFPQETIPDTYDIYLVNSKNTIQKSVRNHKTKKFSNVNERDLKNFDLYIKFYEKHSLGANEDYGVINYPLKKILNMNPTNDKRRVKSRIGLNLVNSERVNKTIEICLRLDKSDKQLMVKVLRCKGLSSETQNIINPYCVIELWKGKSKISNFETKTKYNQISPEWDEAYFFQININDLKTKYLLKIIVFNDTENEKVQLGRLSIPSGEKSKETIHWNLILSKPNENSIMLHNLK